MQLNTLDKCFILMFFLPAVVHEQSACEISSPGHPEEQKALSVFSLANDSNIGRVGTLFQQY